MNASGNSKGRYARYTEEDLILPAGYLSWIVQQKNIFGHWCTGSLVTNKHVLTAAHCLSAVEEGYNLRIAFSNASPPFVRKAFRYIKHPDFHETDHPASDLAIIELEYPVSIPVPDIDLELDCSTVDKDIALPFSVGYSGRDKATVAALKWGAKNQCGSVFSLRYKGSAEGGDSGGPLFYIIDNKSYVIGVTRSTYERGIRTINEYTSLVPLTNQRFLDDHVLIEKYIDTTTNKSVVSGLTLKADDWTEVTGVSTSTVTIPSETVSEIIRTAFAPEKTTEEVMTSESISSEASTTKEETTATIEPATVTSKAVSLSFQKILLSALLIYNILY